jgi:hypothetical protein
VKNIVPYVKVQKKTLETKKKSVAIAGAEELSSATSVRVQGSWAIMMIIAAPDQRNKLSQGGNLNEQQ